MPEMYEPRYPIVWFGDGHWAQLRNRIEMKNATGILGWMMILNPTRELISEYNIQQKDLDEFGFIHRWYPSTIVTVLREDPVSGRIFIATDFEGNETPMTRKQADYLETMKNQEGLIATLRAGNARLTQELNLMVTQPKLWLKTAADIIATINKKTGGGDEDEEYPPFEAPGGPTQ